MRGLDTYRFTAPGRPVNRENTRVFKALRDGRIIWSSNRQLIGRHISVALQYFFMFNLVIIRGCDEAPDRVPFISIIKD